MQINKGICLAEMIKVGKIINSLAPVADGQTGEKRKVVVHGDQGQYNFIMVIQGVF